MTFQELEAVLDKIDDEYSRLRVGLLATNKSIVEAEAIFAEANRKLTDGVIAAFLRYIQNELPVNYLDGADVINKQLALFGVAPKLNLFQFRKDFTLAPDYHVKRITSLMKTTQERTIKTVETMLNYKSSVMKRTLQSKNVFLADVLEAEERVRQGLIAQEARPRVEKDIRDIFTNAKARLAVEDDYMFAITDKNGVQRRMKHDVYAKLVDDHVRFNTYMEAQVTELVNAKQDIGIIPTNSGTEDACINFEGRAVSLTGLTSGQIWQGRTVLDYNEIKKSSVHWGHPNCRHRTFDYVKHEVIDGKLKV